jgi:hypothetical protein
MGNHGNPGENEEGKPLRFRIVLFIFFFFAADFALPSHSFSENAQSSGMIGLRILYAGHQGSARENDFARFLGNYFREVKTVELMKFTKKMTAGFDVVILDYDSESPGEIPASLIADLSKDYSRPTIAVGVTGAMICSALKLKTGYL